jgi:hypothetical protein
MINKLNTNNLRNAEHFQFMGSACHIFEKFGIDKENLQPLYDELQQCLRDAETALAYEKTNEMVRAKNEMDTYRDKLHSKLFNYVKSILYDEKDSRFDHAQTVMKILKDVGNPTRLAENAESAMLTTLGNKLQPYAHQIKAIGATQMVEALMEANNQFIELEKQCRQTTASNIMTKPPAMGTVRKQTDAVYRMIVDAINGYARLNTKKQQYAEMIAEMNVLVAKYDLLMLARKRKKETKKENEKSESTN